MKSLTALVSATALGIGVAVLCSVWPAEAADAIELGHPAGSG